MPAKLKAGELGVISARRRPNGRWQATAGMRAHSGEWRTLTATADSKDRACEAIRQQHSNIVGPVTGRMGITTTLGQASDAWLAYAVGAQPQSLDRYRADAARLLHDLGEGTLVVELHGADIDRYILSFVRNGRLSTARRLQTRLRSILALAGSLGADTANAMRMLARVPASPKKEASLSPEEWRVVLQALEEWNGGHHRGRKSGWRRLRDILTLCLRLGARVGEIVALTQEDISARTSASSRHKSSAEGSPSDWSTRRGVTVVVYPLSRGPTSCFEPPRGWQRRVGH